MIEDRRSRLLGLRTFVNENREQIMEALYSDLRKSPAEASMTEIGVVLDEIACALRNLRKWNAPKPLNAPFMFWPASAKLVQEPLGRVLIISPWNYPFQLALTPLVGAIAAGNAAVLKPSELAPYTSALLAKHLPKYVPGVEVVLGGIPETTALLEERFDLIFFTGSTRVAHVVMEAASKHLTPAILELGGKSPTWVDESVNLKAAARRIAWAKFVNAGQTCVAPDYVMAPPNLVDGLVKEIQLAISKMWGSNPQNSADYGRIINEQQLDRLHALYPDAVIDKADRYMAPTVFRLHDLDSEIMKEEIFGPLLPVIPMNIDEAIAHVNAGEKPLALYVFGKAAKDRFVSETSSGAVGVGIGLIHAGATSLPFGGVGSSGIGAYHGEESWRSFSHLKPVLTKPLWPDTLKMVQPPYSPLGKLVLQFKERLAGGR